MTSGYQPAPPRYRRAARRRVLWAVMGVLLTLTRTRPDAPRIALWEARLRAALLALMDKAQWSVWWTAEQQRQRQRGDGEGAGPSGRAPLRRADPPADLPLPDGLDQELGAPARLVYEVWADAVAAVAAGTPVRLNPDDVARAIATPDVIEQVHDIERTLANRLRGAMWEAYQAETGPGGFERLLREIWTGVAADEARTVVRTEWARAASAATLAAYRRAGISYKAWHNLGDKRVCAQCRANAEAGTIAIDAPFPGTGQYPPQHPRCRCSVSSAYLPA